MANNSWLFLLLIQTSYYNEYKYIIIIKYIKIIDDYQP